MCGILFILSKKKILSKNKCLKSFKKISKRGPDKDLYNFFNKNTIFLANSILNITGKLKKGKNLYCSQDKNNYIAFNGEIYNYKKLKEKYFININTYQNDTEFLAEFTKNLKSYNKLKSLDGMYSFINYNLSKKEIKFATDPQGEKRLYKFENDEYLIISSSPSPIIDFVGKKLEVNKKLIKEYFKTRHFLFITNTIFKEIEIISPGTIYTFSIKKNKIFKKQYDDPIEWIDREKYFRFKKLGFNKTKEILLKKIIKKLDIMKPVKKFSSVLSGGVDSSIISYFLGKYKNLDNFICINNLNKDKVVNNISNFKNIINLKKKIEIRNNDEIYFKLLKSTYLNLESPMTSHDNVGRNQIFKRINKKKIKILFGGDGADELFGGYNSYKNIDFIKNHSKNNSPYSKIKTKENYSKDIWLKVFKKYKEFLSKEEATMQASLFTDYFIQCIGVHNISNDILSGQNSIELRSLFLNKEIIKIAINLPLNFKIEKKRTTITKKILKEIFVDIYGKENLLEKIGFSGFPNESKKFLTNEDIINYKNFTKCLKLVI